MERPITDTKEAMEYPERIINMDAMNYGEHIGDIKGNFLRKNDILKVFLLSLSLFNAQ